MRHHLAMSTRTRILPVLGGSLLGLLTVEAGLQLTKRAVAHTDAPATAHAHATEGGDLRILCLGACYTIGIGTPPESAYPAILEARLDAQLSDSQHDSVVINGGQRGKSIDHFAAEIDSLLTETQPDILIVGVNRRMSLDPTSAGAAGPLQALILPRLISLALAPPPEPSSVRADPLALEIQAKRAALASDPNQPEVISDLATLLAKRGDYRTALDVLAPLVEADQPRPPPVSLRLFRYHIALGEFDTAAEHMAAVRAEPRFTRRMESDLRARVDKYKADGRNARLRGRLDSARLAVIREEHGQARQLLEQVIAMDPDTADAWHLLAWLDDVEGKPASAPSSAFLRRTHDRDADGLRAFEVALTAHVGQIQAAATETGTAVVLHTLAASPEQIPVIQAVGQEHGALVIDVQTALTRVADPDPLFHPTDHLRFSEAGNAWLAEQVHVGLMEAGLVGSP